MTEILKVMSETDIILPPEIKKYIFDTHWTLVYLLGHFLLFIGHLHNLPRQWHVIALILNLLQNFCLI